MCSRFRKQGRGYIPEVYKTLRTQFYPREGEGEKRLSKVEGPQHL